MARLGAVRASVSLLRRNRDFRRLFFASVISLGGDWFLFVAIGSLVFDATGTATSIGLLILSQELPFFAASWFGGILADKKLGYRKSVMIGGFFFMAGHALLAVRSEPVMFAALSYLDIFSIWWLVLVTIGLAAVSKKLGTGTAAVVVFGLYFLMCGLSAVGAMFSPG